MSTPSGRVSTFSSRLQPKERQLGFAASAYAAVILIALWAPHIGGHVAKGSYPPTLGLIGGLLAALAVLASTFYGRRYILGVVSILTVLAFPGTAFVYALPLWGFGGWLMFKASRETSQARRAQRAAGGQGAASARDRVAGAARAGARDARQGSGRKEKEADVDANGRSLPQASKRYTPPRPKSAEEPKGFRGRLAAATKAAERQRRRPRPHPRPGRESTGR
jgi:hypothetical protein